MLARAPRLCVLSSLPVKRKYFVMNLNSNENLRRKVQSENLKQKKKIEEKQQEIKRLLVPKKKTENLQNLPESKID